MMTASTANQPTIAALSKRVAELERENGELRGRVRLLDTITDSTGLLTLQQAAKAVGTGPTRLFEFLRRAHVLTKENVPMQQHIECGRFIVRTGAYYDRGERKVYTRTFCTPKGMQFIAEQLAAAPTGEGN